LLRKIPTKRLELAIPVLELSNVQGAANYGAVDAVILLFVCNTLEFFISHRLALAIAARHAGYLVHVATGYASSDNQLTRLGFEHHFLNLSRGGLNPISEFRSLVSFYKLIRKIRPNLVYLVTVKPVLYGGLVARFSRVPAVVYAISGLGTLFIKTSGRNYWIYSVIKLLFPLALRHPNSRIIFQNQDDASELSRIGALRRRQPVLIKGSGISVSEYPVRKEPDGVPVITFAGRILEDKGIREFIESARILIKRDVAARFWVAGSIDLDSRSSISKEALRLWRQEGLIEFLGYRSDIAEVLALSNIVALPSYREGFPRVLMEAAACGRAIVTTDVPGCRTAIIPNETGLLVPLGDSEKLADALQWLIEHPERRMQMGLAGRRLAEREFYVEDVIKAHTSIYEELTKFC
jgi:glycosyltransferase involved in cell wall biosynthesis